MDRDYLVLLPIGRFPLGMIYEHGTSIPLHTTLMSWFVLEDPLDEPVLEKFLESLALKMSGIELEPERPGLFGPNNDVPVQVLAESDALQAMHHRLLAFLIGIRAKFYSPQWVGEGYTPHVSDVDGKSFPPSSLFVATKITLVLREDTEKTVVGEWELVGNQTV